LRPEFRQFARNTEETYPAEKRLIEVLAELVFLERRDPFQHCTRLGKVRQGSENRGIQLGAFPVDIRLDLKLTAGVSTPELIYANVHELLMPWMVKVFVAGFRISRVELTAPLELMSPAIKTRPSLSRHDVWPLWASAIPPGTLLQDAVIGS
jgi:hypothetical protein